MKKCNKCSGIATVTTTIPQYDADILGAPFKVYLWNAVKVEACAACGNTLSTAIPDPEGLLYAVSFARALHPRKLIGAEIKFLRNAMAWKAKRLAEDLGVSVEYLSRCENGHVSMSVTTEKLLRLFAILRPSSPLDAKTPEARAKDFDVVNDSFKDLIEHLGSFKIESGWDVAAPFDFHFYRGKAVETGDLASDVDNGKWKPEKTRVAA